MAGSEFPAGWYPDPADGARLRWWDGRRWTSHRHVPGEPVLSDHRPARRWTRQQIVAACVLGGFVVLTAGIVLSLVLVDDSPGEDLAIEDVVPPDEAEGGSADGDADEEPDAGSDADPDEDPDTDLDAGSEEAGEGAADPDDGDPDVGDGGEGSEGSGDDGEGDDVGDDDGGDDDGEGAGRDGDGAGVRLDGGCVVDLPDGQDPDEVRAWELEECTLAPVEVGGPAGSWIVVIASFGGEGMTEGEAQDRADQLGYDLLWSTHYPSLNPDLWVVFDGPYPDEDAAEDAADTLGGGSYARVVSDDDADRYCIAADGCVGGEPG